MTYQPILEEQIKQIEELFAELDRKREELECPKMYVDIKIQIPSVVKFITIDVII